MEFADSESDYDTQPGLGRNDFEMPVVNSRSVKVQLVPGETTLLHSEGNENGGLGDVLRRRG